MKSAGKLLVGMAIGSGLIVGLHLLQAQELATPIQAGAFAQDVNAMSDLQVMLQAVEMTPTVSADSMPRFGTFYSAQHAPGTRLAWPPLPGNAYQLSAWNLGNGVYLLDDRNLDYDELGAEADAETALAATMSPMMRMSMMASSFANSYAYGNQVHLTNMAAVSAGYGSVTASFSIAGGTNFVPYDILMSTNMATGFSQWNWLGIGYTSNRYTFNSQPADNAFYVLAKPSKTMTVGFGSDTVGQCDVPFGLTNALQVAGAGVTGAGAHSLALKNDGTVIAWGGNLYGEGSVPTNLTGVAMITAGWYHNVALLTNGTVTAWGLNIPSAGYPLTQVPPDLTNATVISAQALHSLALRSDGTVVAWGYNTQFGETNVPTGLTNVTAISAGYQFNLAVTTNGNGTVVAWGDNTADQCNVPAGLSNVVDVAAGTYHSLALLGNGTVVAWGDNGNGETSVPIGLTNVVAIAASGDPYFPGFDMAYSMALKSDGSVVTWGNDYAADPVGGLNNAIAIAAGADHALAIRTGPRTPVITLEPVDEYQVQGGNATFTARGAGLYGVTYQWQTNGVNLSGATNAALTLTNVQAAQSSNSYDVLVNDNGGMGSIVSSNASLYFVTPPVILSQSPLPTNQIVFYLTNVMLNIVATAPGTNNDFQLSYQWRFNGTNVGANSASYSFQAKANSSGTYSVLVSNAAGSTNAPWQITVIGDHLQFIQQPTNQYQVAGGNAAFVSRAISSNAVTYQWQFNGTNIVAATNALLLLTNVQAAQQGYYGVIAGDSVSTLASSNAFFYLVTAPAIVSQSLPTNITVMLQASVNLSVAASAPGQTNGFSLRYQWQFSGTNFSDQTSSNFTFGAVNSGTYSVIVTNAAGGTNASWQVTVVYPGGVWGWGDDNYGQSDVPAGTNFSVIATGEYHSVGVKDDGSVLQWGYDWQDVPANLTNAVFVAAGYEHSIALRSDGTVTTWGYSNCPGNVVPPNLASVKAVAAGWLHSVVLLTNGTVRAWGDNYYGQTNVPADLTNVTAISACSRHSLALKSDGTVEGWGYNYDGITTAPAGLSNVVAIVTGYVNSLALKADGTVVVWGDNSAGQCNVPAGLSNVMAVAAGWYHCAALKNDGTVVSWGDNSEGQTNTPAISHVKLLAAAGYHTIAGIFSPLVQYPVDMTKDVLLIYNSNSTNSIAVKDYYLAHRPMIAGANVLGVACDQGEFTTSTNCDVQIVAPVLNWLTNNPTKRPEYVVLFYDIPTRLTDLSGANYGNYGSVSYHLHILRSGWQPFVNNINAGSLADCEAYVNKLAYIGTNFSPGKLIISASAGGNANTNYYFEDAEGRPLGIEAVRGVLSNGVASSAVDYDPLTNTVPITQGTNVAGYLTSGANGIWYFGFTNSFGNHYFNNYYTNVFFHGNSSWWIIETIESYNGQRDNGGLQGNFTEWFSSNAFGGANYANTPVGAVTHVEEPTQIGVNNPQILFGLWAAGKNFAVCAWNSRRTPYFQAVGDPFVRQ